MRPVVGVSPWTLAPSCCHASCRVLGLGEDENSSSFGTRGAERAPGYFWCSLRIPSTRRPSKTAHVGARHLGTSGGSELDLSGSSCERHRTARKHFLACGSRD